MRNLPFLGAVFTAISLALPAQTFIVDAANGPGANFSDLPPAIAAVPDGAILLVRPGTYGRIELDGKGMSILATAPGVVITPPFQIPTGGPIVVMNLLASQAVTLRGLTLQGSPLTVRGMVRNCDGPVLIDDFTSQTSATLGEGNVITLAVEQCANVTLRNCHLRASHALDVFRSDVVVENSDLIGEDAFFQIIGFAPGMGAVIDGGSITLARCRVRGGNALSGVAPAAAPAIRASNATVRVCDDGSGVYAAGQQSATAVAAITGTNSTIVRDPSAVVTGSNGGPPVAAGLTSVLRPLPSLRTVPAPPGGTVTADVTTPLGEVVLLAVSLPGPVTTVPGIDGSFRLDPATATMLAIGVPATGVPVTHSIAVPNNQALVGARFAWQAVAWSAANGLRASNPSLYAH